MEKAVAERRKKEGGFTLVELIVVMLILGVLIAIAIPKLAGSTEGAQVASMESDARNAITAENNYYAIERQYASVTVDASNNSDGASATLGTSNISVQASPYNTVDIQTQTCADNSDGFTVTVTSSKTNKQVTYDSCTDTNPKVQ